MSELVFYEEINASFANRFLLDLDLLIEGKERNVIEAI